MSRDFSDNLRNILAYIDYKNKMLGRGPFKPPVRYEDKDNAYFAA